MKYTYKILAPFVGLAAIYWLAESCLHAHQAQGFSIMDGMWRGVSVCDNILRGAVVAAFIGFGYAVAVLNRKRMDARTVAEVAGTDLRTLFSASADGICIVAPDKRILMVNDTLAAMTGDGGEVIGKPCHTVFHSKNCGTARCPLEIINKGGGRITTDVLEKTIGARTIPCIVTATPLYDPNGILIGIVENIRDITEQKKAADGAHQTEALLRALFESTRDAIAVLDPGLRFLFANEATASLLGLTARSIVGMSIAEAFHTFDRRRGEVWEKRVREVLKTAEPVMVEDTLTIAGVLRHNDAVVIPVKDAGGRVFAVGVIQHDITDRKTVEMALRASEERFRTIVENANDIVYSLSLEGIFTYVSPVWTELLGHDTTDVLDRHIDTFIHPDDIQVALETMETIMLSGTKRSGIEYRVRHADGSWRWHTTNASPVIGPEGTVISFIGIARDITRRKQNDAALREGEERYRALVRTSIAAFWIIDTEMRVVELNEAACQMHGYTREEGLTLTIADMNADETPGESAERVRRIIDVGYERFVTRHRRKDGVIFDMEVSASHEPTKNQVICFGSDITERLHAEAALREGEERYRALIGTSTAGFWVFGQDGRFVDANDAVLRMLGHTRDEMLALTLADVEAKEDPVELREHLERIMSAGHERFDTLLYRRDKTIIDAEISVTYEASRQQLICFITDITERRRFEEALQQGEERYRALIATTLSGFWIVDMDRRIVEVNDAACEMHGYTRDEMLSLTIADIDTDETSDETSDETKLKMRRIKTTGHERFEARHRRKDGTIIDVKVNLSYEAARQQMICFITDITETKRAAEAARLGGERLKSMYDISQYPAQDEQDLLDHVLEHAISLTGSTLGYIFIYSEERRELTLNSWSKDVLTECGVLEQKSIIPLDKTGMWGEAVRQRKPIIVNDFTAPNPHKKGVPEGHVQLRRFLTVPVFDHEAIVAVVGVANKIDAYDETDVRQLTVLMDAAWKITERTRADEALRRANEILNHSPVVAFKWLNEPGWPVDYASENVPVIFGWSADDFLSGRVPFVDVIHPDDLGRVISEVEQAAADASVHIIHHAPYRIITKDGAIRWVGDMTTIRRDDTGAPTDLEGIVLDTTERVEAERHRAGLMAEVSASNRELEEFAYVVSHDLKAPLRAIGTLSCWLREDYGDKLDEQGRDTLILLDQRVGRMHSLIDGILQYSRVGRTKEKRERIDLNELVGETIEMLDPPASVTLSVQPGLPAIIGERVRIGQLFANLIGNAVKFIDRPDGEVNVSVRPENGDWLFSVRDNGPGIDKKYHDKVFQIFQTLKARDEFESTGIGLTLVKKIVEMNGGRIWVDSTPGEGCIFNFTLPRGKAHA